MLPIQNGHYPPYQKQEGSEGKEEESVSERSGLSEEVSYLDNHKILKGRAKDSPIPPHYFNWFVNLSIFRQYAALAGKETQAKIELAVLNAYGKAASLSKTDSATLGIQSSPIVPQDSSYHRSVRNLLLSRVHLAYEEKMGVPFYEFVLIDSPLIAEVFERQWPAPDGLNLKIGSKRQFGELIDHLLLKAQSDKFPDQDSKILIDISSYLHKTADKISDMSDIAFDFEQIVYAKLKRFGEKYPDIEQAEVGDKLLAKLQLIAWVNYEGEHVLLIPKFVQPPEKRVPQEIKGFLTEKVLSRHGSFYGDVREIQACSGFVLSPDKAKRAWLRISDLDEILETLDLPKTLLATKGPSVPTVCKRWSDFLKEPLIDKFRALQNEEAPYLRVLPEATFKLLEGLEAEKIDKIFRAEGLGDLLQISYFRLFNAMQEAILHKDDIIIFSNQIDLIHQEVQSLLAIAAPHGKKEFASSTFNTLCWGADPIIPADLNPRAHLKPSAMHCLASVLSGIEEEKKTNKLKVAVAQDCYYNEAKNPLSFAKTHEIFVLPANFVNEKSSSLQDIGALDLFVTEFHHNILHDVQDYQRVDVLGQVKKLVQDKLVAEQFTVVIDTTVDLEKSLNIKNFLADDAIKNLIANGRLNVVFVRSAQKFDMLGLDNYYGGIVITINDGAHFKRFNRRMDLPEDQVEGLSYQGLTHLQKYSGSSRDSYREEIMENTQKLYRMLPEKAIFQEGTTNPMQISAINDERIFFLDIKFPGHPKTMAVFQKLFVQYAKDNKLPLTSRPSFSFINSSLTAMSSPHGDKLRLNVGMEKVTVLKSYAKFFKRVQKVLTLTKKELKRGNTDDLLASRLQQFDTRRL
ncbi:hypothetical protein [Estrella lausannensis]|uniref:Uncharacterized protein n=1 Tax=Estrella lausannensis TaxID=483423 RepID=A0A0H5DQP5_9BACT|nr:hypothetical protein [Estrella lausannensis]CRX38981.1 hypothetical protein ELAC_1654 [Estrella lausannensis]